MARLPSCTFKGCLLEGVDGSYVESSVPASAGLLSHPGRINLPSFTGLSMAVAAMLCTWSRMELWRVMRSPQWPHDRAWSPKTSLGWWQAGQGPSSAYTLQPSLYLAMMINSWEGMWRPSAGMGAGSSQAPARGSPREASLATSRTSPC